MKKQEKRERKKKKEQTGHICTALPHPCPPSYLGPDFLSSWQLQVSAH